MYLFVGREWIWSKPKQILLPGTGLDMGLSFLGYRPNWWLSFWLSLRTSQKPSFLKQDAHIRTERENKTCVSKKKAETTRVGSRGSSNHFCDAREFSPLFMVG